MKKQITIILFTLIFLTGFSFSGFSQFQKTLNIAGGDDYCNVIVTLQNGSTFLVGSTNATPGNGYDALISAIDSAGNPLWSKQYGGTGTEFGTFLMETNDGNMLMVGRSSSYSSSMDMFVVKIDLSGTVLWAKTFGTDSIDYAFRATEDANGYLIVGQTYGAPSTTNGKSDVLMVYVNVAGSAQWTKTMGTTSSNELAYDVISNNPGFVLFGYSGASLIGMNDGVMYSIDSIGNFQIGLACGTVGDDDYRSIVEGPANLVYFIGNTSGGSSTDFMVACYHVNGGLPAFKWLKRYGGVQNESFTYARAVPDGSILMMGSSNSFGNGTQGLGIQIDTAGAVINSKTWGGSGNDFISDVTFLNNGTVFSGYTTSFSAVQSDMYLLGSDSTGNTGCNDSTIIIAAVAMPDTSKTILPGGAFRSDTIVLNVSTQSVTGNTNTATLHVECDGPTSILGNYDQLDFNLYPNPTNGSAEIMIISEKRSNASIRILNSLGESFTDLNKEIVAGKNTFYMDVNHLATGIYYVMVSTPYAQKVVLLSVE